jgi:hypothetical protein
VPHTDTFAIGEVLFGGGAVVKNGGWATRRVRRARPIRE